MATATKKKASPAKAWCECFDKMNEKLADHNAALDLKPPYGMPTGEDRGFSMAVPLFKVDPSKRKPLPTVIMSHCPFCGKHLKA